MERGTPLLYPREQKILKDLGLRSKLARLWRKISTKTVAERAKISRSSVWEVEKGSPSVAIGIYVNILMAIGMVTKLDKGLTDDPPGQLLQDRELLAKGRRQNHVGNP